MIRGMKQLTQLKKKVPAEPSGFSRSSWESGGPQPSMVEEMNPKKWTRRLNSMISKPKCSGKCLEKETPNSTTLSKKIAQGNLTASCKRLISWFLLYKGTELGRKIVPVRPPKF
ncbi:hypothetical protein TNCV_4839441 [Trichonephila clavipes]|nr:hypothetical protein TNCV_4839441 [Trichonephila clavipes]